ncbi:MAG: AI-2E family transporter [Pseudomonadota bacterium]|nr:AI-2E family transporter [Pseudomonadota bacterium]
MFKVFKDWYKTHLTEPNQASFALIILFSIIILYVLVETVAAILVAIILAYMLEGLVQRLQDNIELERQLIVGIVYFFFIALSLILIFLLIPMMLDQLSVLIKSLPKMFEKGKEILIGTSETGAGLLSSEQVDNIFIILNSEMSSLGKSALTYSLSSAGDIFETIIYIFIVPILIFFILYDKENIFSWFKKFFPEKLDLSKKASKELDLKIGNYIRCKFIEIIIVWSVSFIVFGALGLKYSLLLSFLCGISVIIPYIGAIAVTIPIILVGYFQWGASSEFWYVIIGHLAIQLVDGNVVVPILFSDAVNIHPLAILIAILFFGSIWGIWGVFFAIPLAVFLNTLINIWPITKLES